jgi:hypothetical protein
MSAISDGPTCPGVAVDNPIPDDLFCAISAISAISVISGEFWFSDDGDVGDLPMAR